MQVDYESIMVLLLKKNLKNLSNYKWMNSLNKVILNSAFFKPFNKRHNLHPVVVGLSYHYTNAFIF